MHWKMHSGDGWTSNPERRAQQPGWQHDYSPNQRQRAMDRNPNQPEGQQENPHKWVEHQRQQRHWPADDKKNAPEKESEHGGASLQLLLRYFTKVRWKKFRCGEKQFDAILS